MNFGAWPSGAGIKKPVNHVGALAITLIIYLAEDIILSGMIFKMESPFVGLVIIIKRMGTRNYSGISSLSAWVKRPSIN